MLTHVSFKSSSLFIHTAELCYGVSFQNECNLNISNCENRQLRKLFGYLGLLIHFFLVQKSDFKDRLFALCETVSSRSFS